MTVLLRPLPSGDLRLQFLAIGLQQNEGFAVDCGLHGVTDDQAMAGVAGMPPDSFSSGAVDDAYEFHLLDGRPEARAVDNCLLGIYVDEPSRLEIVFRAR